MRGRIGRREFAVGAGATLLAGALGGCAVTRGVGGPPAVVLPRPRAATDRITQITVCTRPFRPQGPRVEVEQVGRSTVVHNYGHGGSGWSLSWGSSALAIELALAGGARDVGVIGCGALGLTSALLLQRAGVRVTIYAKDLPPDVRSSLATGIWSPDSRICLAEHATPAFKRTWERMARTSFRTYQSWLGLPGYPVEFFDNYVVRDASQAASRDEATADSRPAFASLQGELLTDLLPASTDFAPGSHPLGARYLRRRTIMLFNLPSFTHALVNDFLVAGGRIEVREFHSPAEFAELPQTTLIHATGYGARALFDDRSIVPVRGQLAHLIPEPDIHYGIYYRGTAFVPRRDGLVFQVVGDSDYYGYDDARTAPDPAEAALAIRTITGLFPAA